MLQSVGCLSLLISLLEVLLESLSESIRRVRRSFSSIALFIFSSSLLFRTGIEYRSIPLTRFPLSLVYGLPIFGGPTQASSV